jgi:hypothetical protein
MKISLNTHIIDLQAWKEVKAATLVEKFSWEVINVSDSLSSADMDCVRESVEYLIDCKELELNRN